MRRALALMAAALLLTGCGGARVTPLGTMADGTTQPPTGTPVPAPTAAAEAWDLVWFSDSSVAKAVTGYAAAIHERLGVPVRIHNFWGPGDRGSAAFISDLTNVEAVEQAIKEAEVIVLYTNPARTPAGDAVAAACMEGVKGHPPKLYVAADFKEFAESLTSIYERIFELRNGQTVVLRAVDLYVPVLAGWKAAGVERECTSDWEVWTSVLRSAAEAWHVPVASMYDAFNGPNHDQDPTEKGLISSDGAHPSEAGTAAQVAVLDALGYDPVKR